MQRRKDKCPAHSNEPAPAGKSAESPAACRRTRPSRANCPKSAGYKIIGKYPNCQPGSPTDETARAAAAALEEAITLARRGELDAIVTGPVHKARMYQVGFKFPGQTEFFAERCGVKNFAMCLSGGKM